MLLMLSIRAAVPERSGVLNEVPPASCIRRERIRRENAFSWCGKPDKLRAIVGEIGELIIIGYRSDPHWLSKRSPLVVEAIPITSDRAAG
jgi:hypothetical protein